MYTTLLIIWAVAVIVVDYLHVKAIKDYLKGKENE